MDTSTRAAVVYARQSQNKDASIGQQTKIGKARAAAEGWTLHAVYSDGSSASRYAAKERADWPKLRADVRQRRAGDIIWLWESSRGDRRGSTWLAFLEDCRDRGVRIFIETHEREYDLSVARDFKVLADDGNDSEFESAKTSSRVRRAMVDNAKDGRPHGRTPFGYRREYVLNEKGERELIGQVPDPIEADVVKRIYRDIARGVPLRRIATALNAEAAPRRAGNPWDGRIVRDVALRHIYVGKRVHVPGKGGGGTARRVADAATYDAMWPALVDAETWHTARRLLLDPKRRTTDRSSRAIYLLSHIATCAVCDGPLQVRLRGGEPKYQCINAGHVSVPMDDLDYLMQAEAFNLLADPATYAELTSTDQDEQVQAARDRVAELRARYRADREAWLDDQITLEDWNDKRPRHLAKLEAAEKELAERETPSELQALGINPKTKLEKWWDAASANAKRRLMRLLFARIAVTRSPVPGHRVPISQRVEVVPKTSG